jgi:hypothetical protein
MAITSVSDLMAAFRQRVRFMKTGTRTSVTVGLTYTTRDLAGYPRSNPPTNGAGSLVLTNVSGMTAAGLKPQGDNTNAPIWGVPEIYTNTGRYHLTHFELNAIGIAGGAFQLVDLIWAYGTITTNTTINVSSTGLTDISGRVPKKADGATADYSGVGIAVEFVVAPGAGATVTVTYTDQDGNTGHTTGSNAIASLGAGRILYLPLAAGDRGVRQVETIVTTNIGSGQINVFLYRDLALGTLANSADSDIRDVFMTGAEELFSTSALSIWEIAGGTTMGGFRAAAQVASK